MLRSLLYILCGFLMIQACSEAPTKIERDNPDDPEVFGFVLNPVQNISTKILEDKVIEVEWTDSSKVPTHYILKKKLRFSDNYIAIDTLNKDTRKFYDASREITKDTKYEIISLRKQKSGEEAFSQGINSGIDFGGLISSSHTYNADTTAIQINWELETKWPFIAVLSTFDVDVREDIDTVINSNTITTPAFEKDFSERIYQVRLFISEVDLENNNTFKVVDGVYYLGMNFAPEITNVEVINEGKVVINWEDNSNFEDGFRVLRSKGVNRNSASEHEVIAELGPNVTSYTDTLNPITGYARDEFGRERNIKTYYGILAFKNETSTGSFGAEVQFTPPEVSMNISNMTSNSFRISWSTTNSDKIDSFILQKRIDGKNFHDYKFFSKNSTEYIENSLNESYTHHFRIKTLTSKKSNTIAVKHSNYLIEEHRFDFLEARNLRFSDTGDLIISSKGFFHNDSNAEEIGIFNLRTNNTIYNKAPTGSAIVGIDIDEQNNLMALASPANQSFTLHDYNADTVVYQRNSVDVFDVEFGPENKFAYTNSSRDEIFKFDLVNESILFNKSPSSVTSTLRSISISPTGDSIAYNTDGYFGLYSSTGNQINFTHVLDYGSTAQKVDFSKSGKYISNVSDFDKAEIHSTNPASRYLQTGAEHISISYDDKLYITAKSSLLRLFELNTNEQILSHSFSGEVLDLRFSPSEELIAIGSNTGIFIYSISNDKKWSILR